VRELPTFRATCAACGERWDEPALSDFAYGECLLRTADARRFAHVDGFAAIPMKVAAALESKPAAPLWEVLADLASRVDGAAWLVDLRCPRCGFDDCSLDDRAPVGSLVIPDADFSPLEGLDEAVLRARIDAAMTVPKWARRVPSMDAAYLAAVGWNPEAPLSRLHRFYVGPFSGPACGFTLLEFGERGGANTVQNATHIARLRGAWPLRHHVVSGVLDGTVLVYDAGKDHVHEIRIDRDEAELMAGTQRPRFGTSGQFLAWFFGGVPPYVIDPASQPVMPMRDPGAVPGDGLSRLRPVFTDPDSGGEIVIGFDGAGHARDALSLVLQCAAPDTWDPPVIWPLPREPRGDGFHQASRPYAGVDDAMLVASDRVEPFWIRLPRFAVDGIVMPSQLVVVRKGSVPGAPHAVEIALDFDALPPWSDDQIRAFLGLVRRLEGLGGTVGPRYLGEFDQLDFITAFRDDPWQEKD
jgi:hypothetical protein